MLHIYLKYASYSLHRSKYGYEGDLTTLIERYQLCPGEFEGHGDHHRQPRGEDRHPRRLHPREQDRVRQHEDHGPLTTRQQAG